MKKTIIAFLLIISSMNVTAENRVPSFIEQGKTYVGAIAMAGEFIFKVLEIDQQAGWILVETKQLIFRDEKIGWLNVDQLTAMREYED